MEVMRAMRTRQVLLLVAAAAAAAGLVPAGADAAAGAAAPRTYRVTMKLWKATVEGTATIAVTNDPADAIAYAGDRVVFVIRNQSPIAEGFAIDAYGVKVTLQPGETKQVTVRATRPGAFTIYCHLHPWSVHYTGTLLVLPRP
jgi:nitrosocyanin